MNFNYKLSFLFALLGINMVSIGQSEDSLKFIRIFNKIDSFLLNYTDYSKLSSSEYSNGNKIDPKMVQLFKSVHKPGANVANEICPAFYDRDFENPYKLNKYSLEAYCSKMAEIYPKGLDVKLSNANISFEELNNKVIYIVLKKVTRGRTKKGTWIENTDTLEMEVNVSDENEKLLIASTKILGHSLILVNDADLDFVGDDLDKCPKKKWLANMGCPPQPKLLFSPILKLKKIPKEFSGKCKISVYDESERKVLEKDDIAIPGKKLTIDLTSLEVGFYTIQVVVEGKYMDPIKISKT